MKYYIAYGSNMSVEQMAGRCPDAELLGTAVLDGWRLAFKGYATIEKKEGYRTPVLVWRISERDEESLDRYEGFPSLYFKEQIPVRIDAMEGFSAGIEGMAYIMDPRRMESPPSRYYHTVLEDAYRVFAFDMGILERALRESEEAGHGRKEAGE